MELVLDCTAARQLDVVVVDAFATTPYEGNPAAVVVMSCRQFDAPGVEKWMQQVAMERNLSETAYVAPLSEAHVGQNEYRLRWFTPGREMHTTNVLTHVCRCRDRPLRPRDARDRARTLRRWPLRQDGPDSLPHPVFPSHDNMFMSYKGVVGVAS